MNAVSRKCCWADFLQSDRDTVGVHFYGSIFRKSGMRTVSNCCDAFLEIGNSEDLGGDEGDTFFFVCAKCKNPCDQKEIEKPAINERDLNDAQ